MAKKALQTQQKESALAKYSSEKDAFHINFKPN